jgi:hypothetical protein
MFGVVRVGVVRVAVVRVGLTTVVASVDAPVMVPEPLIVIGIMFFQRKMATTTIGESKAVST